MQLVGRDAGYALLRLGSGEVRMVRADCMASIGAVSNPDKANAKLGKAGRKRWIGKRPSVRGVAMNPVDHPHGGGEGRTSGGRHPVTPWGKPTKGAKTSAQQEDGLTDRAPSSQEAIGERSTCHALFGKARSSTAYLLKKAEIAVRGSGRNEIIKTWSRRSTIMPQFVGLTFGVYNGKKFLPVLVTENMVGPQVRRVCADSYLLRSRRGQEGQEGLDPWVSRNIPVVWPRSKRKHRCACNLRTSAAEAEPGRRLDPRHVGRGAPWRS